MLALTVDPAIPKSKIKNCLRLGSGIVQATDSCFKKEREVSRKKRKTPKKEGRKNCKL